MGICGVQGRIYRAEGDLWGSPARTPSVVAPGDGSSGSLRADEIRAVGPVPKMLWGGSANAWGAAMPGGEEECYGAALWGSATGCYGAEWGAMGCCGDGAGQSCGALRGIMEQNCGVLQSYGAQQWGAVGIIGLELWGFAECYGAVLWG